MKILITAGNTQTPIDDVRVITNVFSGRTGGLIALAARDRGHSVCLLTSHPDNVAEHTASTKAGDTWTVRPYRTFDDLQRLLEQVITTERPDVIIHSAAVSDYRLAGTYVPTGDLEFDPVQKTWRKTAGEQGDSASQSPVFIDVTAGKIKSNHSELWMRMVPTPKLVDLIRTPWGFRGILVKFKLEVGPTDEELIRIAEASRTHSHADLMVANTYSGMRHCAFLGPVNGEYQRVERTDLADRLLDEIEKKHHGGA